MLLVYPPGEHPGQHDVRRCHDAGCPPLPRHQDEERSHPGEPGPDDRPRELDTGSEVPFAGGVDHRIETSGEVWVLQVRHTVWCRPGVHRHVVERPEVPCGDRLGQRRRRRRQGRRGDEGRRGQDQPEPHLSGSGGRRVRCDGLMERSDQLTGRQDAAGRHSCRAHGQAQGRQRVGRSRCPQHPAVERHATKRRGHQSRARTFHARKLTADADLGRVL